MIISAQLDHLYSANHYRILARVDIERHEDGWCISWKTNRVSDRYMLETARGKTRVFKSLDTAVKTLESVGVKVFGLGFKQSYQEWLDK